MKKFFRSIAAIFFLTFFIGFAAQAQVVIKIRPAAPVARVRPVSPGPRHIWISGEYAWRNNRYEYREGYWALPPGHYRNWREGHWKQRSGGWVWIPGHWRR